MSGVASIQAVAFLAYIVLHLVEGKVTFIQSPSGTVCPGENVTFTCNTSTGVLRWGYKEKYPFFSSEQDTENSKSQIDDLKIYLIAVQNLSIVSQAYFAKGVHLNHTGRIIQCYDFLPTLKTNTSQQEKITINVAGLPGSPQGILFETKNISSLTLSWDPPIDSSSCISMYSIYINGTLRYNATNTSIVVSDLEQGKVYNFTVSGWNGEQEGTKSAPTAINWNVFSQSVEGINHSYSHNGLQLIWECLKNKMYPKIDYYLIEQNISDELVNTTFCYHTIITTLRIGDVFFFNLSGYNIFGASPFAVYYVTIIYDIHTTFETIMPSGTALPQFTNTEGITSGSFGAAVTTLASYSLHMQSVKDTHKKVEEFDFISVLGPIAGVVILFIVFSITTLLIFLISKKKCVSQEESLTVNSELKSSAAKMRNFEDQNNQIFKTSLFSGKERGALISYDELEIPPPIPPYDPVNEPPPILTNEEDSSCIHTSTPENTTGLYSKLNWSGSSTSHHPRFESEIKNTSLNSVAYDTLHSSFKKGNPSCKESLSRIVYAELGEISKENRPTVPPASGVDGKAIYSTLCAEKPPPLPAKCT